MAGSGKAIAWPRLSMLPPGGALETALLLLLACCISVGQGQDRNWDLLNYHLYNAFSFVEGRFARDLYPVGMQSYFNPLIDLPYYLLSVQLIPGLPRVVAFLAGIPFGLLIVVVLRIARILLPPSTSAQVWLAPVATAIGVSGSATWSEIGTTFGDIPVSVLALGGFLVPLSLLPHRETTPRGTWIKAMLGAGLLFGCAAGLKPTACIFAPGALLGLTLTAGSWRRGGAGVAVFCIGWTAGFVLVDGWWGFILFRRFQSPFFPMWNHVFASPWMPADSFNDPRFLPRDLWQALFYPFFWLRGRAFVVAEVGVRDPRFALAYIALASLACTALVRRSIATRSTASITLQPAAIALSVFMSVSYVVWEAMFSILRYAVGLEALTGIIIILGVRATACYGPWNIPIMKRLPVVCAVLLVAIVAASSRPGWGRLRQYGTKTFDVVVPAIPDGAMIILADKPLGFVAPFLRGHDSNYVGIVDLPGLGRLNIEIQRRIRHATQALVLIDKPPESYAARLRSFGRQIDPATCHRIDNSFDRNLVLCATQAADRP